MHLLRLDVNAYYCSSDNKLNIVPDTLATYCLTLAPVPRICPYTAAALSGISRALKSLTLRWFLMMSRMSIQAMQRRKQRYIKFRTTSQSFLLDFALLATLSS